MHTSLITKKRIAKTFALLLEKKEFDKISVSNIMELSGIRRQTFYNYFLEKRGTLLTSGKAAWRLKNL